MVWSEFLSVFLQSVLEIFLPILFAMATAWIYSLYKKTMAQAKEKMGDHQYYIVESIVRSAVLAAEQVNLHGELVDKKEYALNVAQNWLAQYGIKLDFGVLDAVIESAVLEQFNIDKVKPTEGVG